MLGIGTTPGAANEASLPTHYDVVVDILPASHSIRVTGTWTIPAQDVLGKAASPLKAVQFWSSEKLLHLKLDYAGTPLRVTCRPAEGQLKCEGSFRSPEQPSYALHLAYRTDGQPVAQLRIDPDQAFAGSSGDYWYPQLTAIQRASARIRFNTPSIFTVVAPGEVRKRTVHGKTASTDYEILAPVSLGFAAAPYSVSTNGICSLYLLRELAAAPDIAADCARIATALTHVWGPLPRGNVKLVEVDFRGLLLGVGESGYILADASEIHRKFELNYWAHELSHQWWGSSVHAKYPSPGNSLLTEGMAEFGALSANRELGGKAGESDYLSDRLANEPSGAPMAHYLRVVARHEDLALTSLPVGSDGTHLHYVVTSKGVMTIDMLATLIGAPLFQRICAEFLRLNADRETTWGAFEKFVAERAGQDLTWFYQQWFDQKGLPFLYATWTHAGDGVDIEVHQCAAPYRFDRLPLQLRYSTTGGASESRIVYGNFNGVRSSTHVEAISGVYSVNPDPGHTHLWLPGLCE